MATLTTLADLPPDLLLRLWPAECVLAGLCCGRHFREELCKQHEGQRGSDAGEAVELRSRETLTSCELISGVSCLARRFSRPIALVLRLQRADRESFEALASIVAATGAWMVRLDVSCARGGWVEGREDDADEGMLAFAEAVGPPPSGSPANLSIACSERAS
jgi:hypothetical protein